MSLMNTAAQLLMAKLGPAASGVDAGAVADGLKDLLPTSGGDIDLQQIVSRFTESGGGIAELAMSWLGNGGNLSISAEQVQSVLGGSNIAAFAQRLGIDAGALTSGLSGMLPDLIDKVSSDGQLSGDLVGNMAKGLLGKFF